MLAAGRVAIMFLLKQNQLLENRNYTYHLEVERLKTELERLKTLELEVAALRERLGQNSQNSSKPPSSDPPSVSRPNNRQPSGRKRGGQPGHQGRARKLLPVEEVDTVIELRPTACQQCGHLLMGNDPDPARHQVSEIPPVKAEVTEYRQHRLSCPACGEVTAAEWPAEMPRGSFGPRAQAVVGVSLWTFVREEGVEPTNNDAERPLRRAVLWRRKSFGTQSESGSRFVERIMTVVTSLRQQDRDVLEYLTSACASLKGESGSICLVPDSG